jgi:hypothetical protein
VFFLNSKGFYENLKPSNTKITKPMEFCVPVAINVERKQNIAEY